MVLPHEIYIDQLAFSLGGCPLWGSLHPQDDPVDIADVGYLSDSGGWLKLFNLRTETDPKKLPSNHQPGSVVITDQDVDKDIFKGPRYSKSIRKAGGSIEVQGKAEAGLSYECAEEKGAILFVAEDAVTRNALNKIQLAKLIQENIENWMEFTKRKGRDVRITDLVLVTGYVRTTTWVAAAFRQKSQWCKFKVGGVLPVGEAKLELWGSLDVDAFAWTGGPEDRMKTGTPLDTTHFLKHMAPNISPPALLCKNDPRHQCVLIRGYRMARRNWREILPFKKNKLLKGIEVLKRNPRNLAGITEGDEHTAILPDVYYPANPGNATDAPTVGTGITTAVVDTDTFPEQTSTPVVVYLINEDESRGTRRTRRRGSNNPDRGNTNNRRRDGGAGAGSSSGGSSGVGCQSGFGSAANSGGQSSGASETSQQKGKTSRNVKDSLNELDPSEPEHRSSWAIDWYEGSSESEEFEPSGSECSGESMTEEKAKYAIIHDDDFSILPTEVESTSELRAQLQVLRPRIYLNGSVGMLKPTALEFFRSTGYFRQSDPVGLMAYFPKLSSSTPAGQSGSDSFYTFSDYRENPEILFATLKKIYIYAQTYIHSIQCEYQGPERKMLLGNRHGNSREAPLYVFELGSDEYIIKIRGRSGEYIEQLQFLTNKETHFDGALSENYLRTLKACFPIYPWFEDGTKSVVSEIKLTEDSSPSRVETNTRSKFTIKDVCEALMIFPKDETGNVQHIRVDASLQLLQETEGQLYIRHEFRKVLEMLNSSQPSAVHYASMIVAELARLGGFELEIRNMLLDSIHHLLQDQERYILLQKLLEQAQFQPSIIAVLPGFIWSLIHNDSHLQANAANAIGKLVEREEFRSRLEDHIPALVRNLINLLKADNLFTQLSGRNILIKLSRLEEYQTAIVERIPDFLDLVDNGSLLVKESGILFLAELADHVKHYKKLDYCVSQLIGMLEDDNEDLRNNSADIIVKLLKCVKDPSLVFRLIDLTTKSNICKVNGVNALLTISEEGSLGLFYSELATHGNAISTAISQAIPDLVEMLRSDNWKPVVAILGQIAKRPEFRQEIMKSVLGVKISLQQRTHSLGICLAGIELLTALSEYTEARQVIVNDLTFSLTFLNDKETSVVLASLSLFEVLSTNTTLVTLMAPLVIPCIKEIFVRGMLEMDHKGIAILLNISKQVGLGAYKNAVANIIKEVALDIANSLIREKNRSSYLQSAEHGSSSLKGLRTPKYVNGTKLLKLFSEQVEFQNPILEAIPAFVDTAKGYNHASVYDILKILSVHEKIESTGTRPNLRHMQECLDLLWSLSEQAAYQPAIMLFVPHLASLMKANSSTRDVRITMAGILINFRILSSNTDSNSMGTQESIDSISILDSQYYAATTEFPGFSAFNSENRIVDQTLSSESIIDLTINGIASPQVSTSLSNSHETLPISKLGSSTSNSVPAINTSITYHDVRLRSVIDDASLERSLLLLSSRPKIYRCIVPYCMSPELKGTQAAKAHVYQHLFGTSKPYVCRTCNLEFASERAAERHRQHQEQKFTCGICGRSFMRKNTVLAHEKRCRGADSTLLQKPKSVYQPTPTIVENSGAHLVDQSGYHQGLSLAPYAVFSPSCYSENAEVSMIGERVYPPRDFTVM
ncbi:hypothetical protein Clacol_008727 [Clathrus columnatus]|uniref:C2H2-type domain-containing protein n=1 Tax=Clathrus columnatus TaxID=1419009 RepID=A0AAV5ALV3_9AGAM|nr:hypothetical protein Clacol_008727 [Clathrus columnatus]